MRSKDDIYKSVGVGRTDIIQVDSRRKIVVGEKCVAAFDLTEVVSDFETDGLQRVKLVADVRNVISRLSLAQIKVNKTMANFDRRRNISKALGRCVDLDLQGEASAAMRELDAARKNLGEMWKRLVKLGGR